MRAICGGGRYDNLFKDFDAGTFSSAHQSNSSSSNFDVPAIGFGFGDAVIVELLKIKGILPDFSKKSTCKVLVYAMESTTGGPLYKEAVKITSQLRDNGISTELVLQPGKKAKWAFQRADRLNAGLSEFSFFFDYLFLSDISLMVAPEEFAQSKVVVKQMKTGEQTLIELKSLVATIISLCT